MDNVDLTVLETAARWQRAGHACVLGTIVHTWGSAPRPVGSMVVIRADGKMAGSVSGGCIEDDLIARAREGTLMPAHGYPTKVSYGVQADEARRFGLPCGGTLSLVLETLGTRSRLQPLLDALRHRPLPGMDRAAGHTPSETDGGNPPDEVTVLRALGQRTLVARRLDIRTGDVQLILNDEMAALQFEYTGTHLTTVHGAAYRLVLIGAGEIAEHLARMAVPLGYQVIVCDPRDHYEHGADGDALHTMAGVTMTTAMPDDVVLGIAVDARTAIIALTHDPKLDDLALIDALQSDAFYVGAIGSRKNRAARCDRLRLFDLDDRQLTRLRSPVGLYIGATTPVEIAVSIIAELTAFRHSVPVLQSHGLRERHVPGQDAETAPMTTSAPLGPA